MMEEGERKELGKGRRRDVCKMEEVATVWGRRRRRRECGKLGGGGGGEECRGGARLRGGISGENVEELGEGID